MTDFGYGLGRMPAEDSRDEMHLMQGVLPSIIELRLHRYWYDRGWWGDQGDMPYCVGYAWVHWLEDGPITQAGQAPCCNPTDVYTAAQLVDEWPGTDYDGTSVRAGAKVLQSIGKISSYTWAWSVEPIIQALLYVGPVVVGTNWYRSMFDPKDDILRADGRAVGGHAYVLNGVNLARGLVRIKNSWGRSWAGDGRAWMEIETLDRLIREDGEACLAKEIGS
jgi:hypothetical protein